MIGKCKYIGILLNIHNIYVCICKSYIITWYITKIYNFIKDCVWTAE